MPRLVGAILVVVMVVIGIGILIPFIFKARGVNDRVVCQDHLRQIGFGLFQASAPGQVGPESSTEFPAGTVLSPLPHEDRLGWTVLLLPSIGRDATNPRGRPRANPVGGILEHLQLQEGWRSEQNLVASRLRVKTLICPTGIPEVAPGDSQPTQYVGIAGLGLDVAKRSRQEAGKSAGVFRYDEPTPIAAFLDGISNTVAVSETNVELGPWLAGGWPTVRGVDPMEPSYFGVGRPFGGLHLGGTNIGMADGAVRFVSDRVDPTIFRAMCTIAGQESVVE